MLDAAVTLFIKSNICVRESTGDVILLIFPSLINEKRPLNIDFEQIEGASFTISGAVEHAYPSLVVLLGYTNLFRRTNQWQNHAQYETAQGHICGFRQITEREGQIELVLYFDKQNTPDVTRDMFESTVRMFLNQRNLKIIEYKPVVCHQCKTIQERATVIKRIEQGKTVIRCAECGARIYLTGVASRANIRSEATTELLSERTQAELRTAYEEKMTYIKSLQRNQAKTICCFVSYSWDSPEHLRWVLQFAIDLRNAGFDVLTDQEFLQPGKNISRYEEKIAASDFVMVIGTPGYAERHKNIREEGKGTGVAAEMDLINVRLTRGNEAEKETIIPILRSGEMGISFPPFLHPKLYSDFTDDLRYFVQMFDLVLTIYGINFTDPAVYDLRQELEAMAQRYGK